MQCDGNAFNRVYVCMYNVIHTTFLFKPSLCNLLLQDRMSRFKSGLLSAYDMCCMMEWIQEEQTRPLLSLPTPPNVWLTPTYVLSIMSRVPGVASVPVVSLYAAK